MNTPFQFPCLSLQQLKEFCPSKAKGRNWRSELAYRDECIDRINNTCDELKISTETKQRSVILLHRYFTVNPSTECSGLAKWAVATACVFVASKLDSVYHRLENIVHTSICELRRAQQRSMEPEYFNADGTRPNPAFLAPLVQMVREAESEVLFAINFALSISVPTTVVATQLRKLGLTDEAEMAYPDLAEKIRAVRKEAMKTAALCCDKGSVVCMVHPVRHISLAAIFRACKANKLQWYLKQPADVPLVTCADENVPDLTIKQLKTITRDLPAIAEPGSSLVKDPQHNDGHGCFRSRGGRWLSRSARKPALIKYEGGIRLSSNATDSSNGEAATAMQPGGLCEPSPSPESTNGPCSAAAAGGGGSSGGSSSRAQRHVRFGELPPSVSILQAQFRQRAAKYEKLHRERSPEPRGSLDSDADEEEGGACDVEDECEQLLQQPLAPQELEQLQQQRAKREQLLQQARRHMKRSRDESVGLAAGSDEEDSAVSRPGQQQGFAEQQDCAGSKRVKAAAEL